MSKPFHILSLGSIYLDINCLQFPFTDSLKVETETVGSVYQYQAGGSAVISATVSASLGLKPVFVGKVGEDEFGDLVAIFLRNQNIEPGLIKSPDVQTNLGLNYVNDAGKTLMTVVGSANQSLEPEEILAQVEKYLDQIEYLYLGGYFKLKKLMPYYPKLIQDAKSRGVKIILDHGRVTNETAPEQLKQLREIIQNIDIYLPSEDEFLKVWQSDSVEAGLQNPRPQTKALIAIKRAEKGATGIDENGVVHSAPGFKVLPLNTVGAGDSFNAGFLKAVTLGLSFAECLRFANATAALKISQAIPPTQDEVQALMNSQEK